MPRWIGGFALLAAANALYVLYDSRGKKNFFLGTMRVSARTSRIHAALVIVLCLADALFLFFGPWPKK